MSNARSSLDRAVVSETLATVFATVRRSFTLSMAVAGVVLILIGAAFFDGILAGMFGAWGISAIVAGLLGYSVLMALRRRRS